MGTAEAYCPLSCYSWKHAHMKTTTETLTTTGEWTSSSSGGVLLTSSYTTTSELLDDNQTRVAVTSKATMQALSTPRIHDFLCAVCTILVLLRHHVQTL